MGYRRKFARKVAKSYVNNVVKSYAPKAIVAVAKDVARIKKQLRVQRPQLKLDGRSASISAGSINASTPYSTLLNGYSEGTSETNRIGNTVVNKFINFKVQLFCAANIRNFRMMCICLKNPAGSATTLLSGLFGTTTPNTYTNYDMEDRNIRQYYSILYDRIHKTKAQYSGAGNFIQFTRKFHLRNAKSTYELGSAGTIADIAKCAYYWVVICDDATSNDTTMYLNWMLATTNA